MEDDKNRDLLKSLVLSNIISDELLPKPVEKQLTCDELYKVLTSAYDLGYDDDTNELYYVDDHGEKFICPDMAEGMSTCSEWMCDVLPVPNVDIDQGGSVRRSVEIRSLYTLVCISLVFGDLSDEIRSYIDDYNFTEFVSGERLYAQYSSAAVFLKSFTDLNSLQINCVVSAASINLTQYQEKKDALWRSNLTRVETLELSKISRDIKGVILRYEKDKFLNPADISSLSKIEKLTAIEMRDLEIEKIINASKYATLYRITKLNSERLSPIAKRKILNVARSMAEQQVIATNETSKLLMNEIYDKTFYEQQRVLTKKAVSSLVDKQIKIYKQDPNGYVFKKKI